MTTDTMTVERQDISDLDAARAWLADARPGAKCVYLTGHLAKDREGKGERAKKIDRLGTLFMQAALERKVRLVQRRIERNRFRYLAVKSCR